MKNTKTQKGITLVALIITIIVLLILAVVAIASVEESGIIKHADNAVAKHEEGKAKEDAELEKFENFLDEYSNKDKIKYYIYDGYLIQKIDFNADVCTTIFLEDGVYQIVGNTKVISKTNISESVEIKLTDGTMKTIEAGSLNVTAEHEGTTIENAVFIVGDKIYAKDLSTDTDIYLAFTQITDAEQIADIEEAIANAQ